MTRAIAAVPDLLETIVAATRRRVASAKTRRSRQALERESEDRPRRPDRFRHALAAADRVNIIAECKRRSPSRGVLRAQYDPVGVATAYARAGAAGLSVLTEPMFFDGALEHLAAIRQAVELPILRKDFVIDEYQLLEARASGADAVLLIAAALPDAELARLQRDARALDLEALVEVHDVHELERALDAGAGLIGVNNRNLRTLEVDTRVSEAVAARLPGEVIAVSESGLQTGADLDRLRNLGYRAFLIGERFMTAPDPGEALRELLRTGGDPGRQ